MNGQVIELDKWEIGFGSEGRANCWEKNIRESSDGEYYKAEDVEELIRQYEDKLQDKHQQEDKEKLISVSLEVLPLIIGDYKLDDAVTESKRVAKILLDL